MRLKKDVDGWDIGERKRRRPSDDPAMTKSESVSLVEIT